MNEQLQTKLLEFMDVTLSGIDSTVGFMSEQLPDYINQLLTWYCVISGLHCLLSIVVVIINYYFIKIHLKFLKGKNWESHPHTIVPHMALIVISGPISIACWNMEWLQIIIAPKVWLIEYASKLV